MTQYAILVSFVDSPEAFVTEITQDTINCIKRNPEPIKSIDDLIYEFDAEEYLVVSNSIERACYVALCKLLQDITKFWQPKPSETYSDFIADITKQSIETLLSKIPTNEEWLRNYIIKNQF